MKFEVGDKVKYIGNITPSLRNIEGIIEYIETDRDNIKVKWDDDLKSYGVMKNNIELVERKNDMSYGDKKKFWMVTSDMNAPRVRHTSLYSAESEAKRLAKENPNKEFYVLEAVSGWKDEPQPTVKRIL